MLLAVLALLAASVLAPSPGPQGWGAALTPAITFRARERSVSNWRAQAVANLDASWALSAKILLGHDPPAVSRCVRLNNYWCIKRAGWAGEIASDGEGHVAFASAAEGADVAALLLRRYYVDLGRHSALAIVSRWAPASCGPTLAQGTGRRVGRGTADHLAARGIGHTLRARFLASRGRGGARPRRSVVPDRLIGRVTPAPTIAIGLGEVPLSLGGADGRPLALGTLVSSTLVSGAGPTCRGDDARIAHYARRAVAGIAATPTEDLKLFDASGRPTENLARLLRNMAAVEVGPLGARAALIEAAVARASVAGSRTDPPVARR